MQRKLEALRRLLDVIDRLRGPGGCPWDKSRELRDMGAYLLEEVGETIDAIEDSRGSPTQKVCEELGDVLMNVVLAARIAEDLGGFDMAQVAEGIAEKLVYRHPHVFGTARVEGVPDVLANWEALKQKEKSRHAPGNAGASNKDAGEGRAPGTSLLDSVPRNLPLLERAVAIGRAAAQGGFDWPTAEEAFEKVTEEVEEVRAAMERARGGGGTLSPEDAREVLSSELGDLLFAVANLCRKLDVSPEAALRHTLRKFRERFEAIERKFPDLNAATLEEMEAVWQASKKQVPDGGSSAPHSLKSSGPESTSGEGT